jgi:hypothetical protein
MNMNESLHAFLAEHNNFDGICNPPVCRDLEGRYDRIFSNFEVDDAGIYRMNEHLVLAEFRSAPVFGLSEWVTGAQYSMVKNVLIKNPQRLAAVNLHLEYGERNALYLDEQSEIVFAGKVTMDERVTLSRPVMRQYQDRFRSVLENLNQSVSQLPFKTEAA